MNQVPIVGRRQKLRRIEVLRAADKEARTREWFEGKVPEQDINRDDRGQATRDLLNIGLLERDHFYPQARHPHPYRLTQQGRTFLSEVKKKIGKGNSIDWNALKKLNSLYRSVQSLQNISKHWRVGIKFRLKQKDKAYG